jgi:hypothetical protein
MAGSEELFVPLYRKEADGSGGEIYLAFLCVFISVFYTGPETTNS